MGEIATCPPNFRWLEPATPDFSGLPPAEELLEVIEAFHIDVASPPYN